MNFVAGTLYKILNDEYDAFLGLMYIMRTLNWRCMYLHNTPKLQNLLLLIQKSVDDSCPELSSHLRLNDVHSFSRNKLRYLDNHRGILLTVFADSGSL